ncbi:MAG: DNA-binding response regulator [Cyclobacteriaceae bacterium]|nr:MAG: DNA-binding response regulator [Cyclobacteriaceae bacterium]
MKVLIIEDESLAADKLERMILRYDQSINILDKLRSVEESRIWFQNNQPPDLLFMDIHLLDGTCFDLLDEIDISCPVIFTTAYQDFVFESFKVHSLDYLIKPVNYKKLQSSLEKFEKLFSKAPGQEEATEYQQVMQALKSAGKDYKTRFLVKFGSRLLPIGIEQVGYFASRDRITFLITTEGKKYPISATLDELEASLDPSLFFRINRQLILHVQSIRQVHKYFNGRLKVDLNQQTEEEIMVSSRRASEFQQWLDK